MTIKLKGKKMEQRPLSQEQFNKLAEAQKLYGFGDPSSNYTNLCNYSETNCELEKIFEYIQDPTKSFIMLNTEHRNLGSTDPPKFGMVKLDKKLVGIFFCGYDSSYNKVNCTANVPLMPSPVQELCRRAQELAPKIELYMILEPAWTKIVQADPVIVGLNDGEWFKIAWWDGDSEFINKKLDKQSWLEKFLGK